MLSMSPAMRGLLNERPIASDASVHTRLLSALMDRLECGVMACGASGELLHANSAARRTLAARERLQLVDGRVCALSAQQEAWSAALHEAAVRHRTRLLTLQDGDDSLIVALVPVHVEGIGQPAVVVMLGRQMVCSPLGLEMLAARHGLTHAERRVLQALISNCTTREIAASHGVAMATVRTQIQSVRDKLGVRSIDALLLRAAELPPVTACY